MTAQRVAVNEWLRAHRPEVGWCLLVVLLYLAATVVVARGEDPAVSRAMTLAIHLSEGRLDLGGPVDATDTLTIDGVTYWVVGPMVVLPFLPLVPLQGLWEAARWIVPLSFGIVAAWLMLPLARRYGPGGRSTWWLAVLGAFGTLLFNQAVRGNDYYLTHAEAMAFTVCALVEWRGRRRPWVIGLALGLAGIARPPVLLALVPFGIALAWSGPGIRRRLLAFATPVGLLIVLAAAYNALRFGSPLETGYGGSVLTNVSLESDRAVGVLSIRHVPHNLQLLLVNGFAFGKHFPFLVPDPDGHSILLTSPALLAAVGAGIRSRTAAVLWICAGLITLALLLYYGGGGRVTYGYRYFLDATPFLLALTAVAARRQFGALERLLIVMSVAFVSYGFVWIAFGQ
ncbi:MAG: hypothetical protein ACJ77O_14130 [Chloroflexota bacterium]